MLRLPKITMLALVILLGLWLSASGIYSICRTTIGGVYVTTEENCFFIPDIGGWIGRVWQSGVTIAGAFLVWIGARSLFAAMTLDQPCACSSDRNYRHCCFRRERAFLVIGVLTVVAMFTTYALGLSLGPCVGILLSAGLVFWLVSRRFSRSHHQVKRI
jgi:hypothetical protein